MFCAVTGPRYQVSVYRTIGPLVLTWINEFIWTLFSKFVYFTFLGILFQSFGEKKIPNVRNLEVASQNLK